MKRNVYLDHNATTPVSPAVRRTMQRALKHFWGNPSSDYRIGKMAAQVLEKARQHVADAVHAHAHEIYFTSCATESNNAILKSLSYHFHPDKKKIISSPVEHPSVMNTLEFLKSQGITVQYCPVDRHGFVLIKELEDMTDDQTFLICCMLANNETGAVQDMETISAIAKSKNILLFSDCVQAFGKIPVDVKELDVDYASFSAHKLYGPKGVGAMYARITAPQVQLLHGGHQEEGLRAGTESIHNIAGFGAACKQVGSLAAHSFALDELKKILEQGLKAAYPDAVVNSPEENCLANTLNITFPGIKSSELMRMLDYYGIAVSSGSACSSQQNKPSHILKAIGLSDKAADETVRISLGKDTSLKDVRYVIKVTEKFLYEKNN